MKRSFIFLAVLAGSVGILFAQSVWEGTAIVGGYNQFPREGLYAASNSFERNTVIEVTNEDNGRTAEVLVVGRVSQPGIFLVLSEDAADVLRLDTSDPAQVRVRPATAGGLAPVPSGPESAFSRDPEVNPSASLTDPNAEVLRRRGRVAEPADEPPAAAEPESAAEPAAEQEPAPEPAPEPEEAPAEIAAEAAQTLPTPPLPEEEEPENGIPEPEVPQAIRPEDEGVAEEATAAEDAAAADDADTTEPAEVTPRETPGRGLLQGIRSASAGLGAAVSEDGEDQAAESFPVPEPAPAGEPEARVAVPRAPEPEPEPAPEESAAQAPEVDSEPPAEPEASEPGVLARTLRSLRERFPQKELFPAPQEESVGTFLSRPLPPDEMEELAEARVAAPSPAPREEAEEAVAAEEEAPEAEETPEPEVDRVEPTGLPLVNAPDDTGDMGSRMAAPRPQGPTAEGLGRISAPEEAVRDSLAAVPNAPAGGDEEPALAEETITPELPEDALVDLEPAELRPPELANPADESLSYSGAEEDEDVAAGDTPAPRLAAEEEAPDAAAQAEPEEAPDAAALARIPMEEGAADYLGPVEPPSREFAPGAEAPDLAASSPEPPLAPVAPPQEPAPAPGAETIAEPRLEPAEPRPPKGEETEAPAVAAAPEPRRRETEVDLPLIDTLAAEAYYLQVAAFSDPRRAKNAVETLSGTYPVAVIPSERGDGAFYRLFVGPLNEDERGSVLYWVRNRGYADAFIRKGGA